MAAKKKKVNSIDPTLKQLFDQMPGLWGCKDKNSVFTYANKEYTKLVGIGENNMDIIGKTDADVPCEINNCVELFWQQDKEVMLTEKRMRVLDIHPFAGGKWKALITTKAPLYDKDDGNKLIGTIFQATDITNTSMIELGSMLSKITEEITPEFFNKNSYLLSTETQKIKLSPRESECLFFTLRGKTAKQIAKYLNISYRTVEDYLNTLKDKFSSKNKYELIDRAIQAGFLNTIPESIFCTQLSIVLRED